MIYDVVQFPDVILFTKASPITEIDDDIKNLAEGMHETMKHKNGIGLAANQVNRLVRLIVWDIGVPKTLINPEITKAEGAEYDSEGCLSRPGHRTYIQRATHVVVKGLDLDGNEVTMSAQGLEARVIQHETDHLNGINEWEHPTAKEGDEVSKNQLKSAKIGRNDPCPCGSGKKYKKCCG